MNSEWIRRPFFRSCFAPSSLRSSHTKQSGEREKEKRKENLSDRYLKGRKEEGFITPQGGLDGGQ